MFLLHRTTCYFAAILTAFAGSSQAAADTVNIYSAGSLRAVVSDLTSRGAAMGIEVKATFGGSGTLRGQIEKGATPDIFMSADVGSPEALAAKGRTVVPAIAFARNRVCLVARKSLGITPSNMVAKLMSQDVRIKTSQPIADPSGDYAMAMFDLMDRAQPGAARTLKAKAAKLWAIPAPKVQADANPTAALFDAKLIDVAVTYCSASGAVTKAGHDLVSLAVPPRFAPHPVYGLALLSDKPSAARLALFLLSETGQEAVAHAGLLPLLDSGNAPGPSK